ncbi:hypothetical protein PR048_024965 [Dryococelus australis]|uniref:Uncharacterized protein n=1 Tax=Dryococelus australis TaxID=614101 RepID=A0ABQ9GQ50_9NEOP|nr:hypothetical protein PR048_024965 [Dryococelus australis]
MDNFDKEEDTPSGVGGTHDTVLVIFHDGDNLPQNKATNLDCKKLEELDTTIYESFKKGSFVVQHGTRKFSSVGMDKTHEQVYNKLDEGHGGIIGLTRWKQAVAQRDIIKHEKLCINQFYRKMGGLQYDDAYTLHTVFFAKYLVESNYFSSTPIYFGGIGKDGQTSIRYGNGKEQDISCLQSDLEADERLCLHVHHAVAGNAEYIIIASSYTDVCVCVVYHFFKSFKKEGLSELRGQGNTSRVVPIYKLVEDLDNSTIEILPALRAITGCDTTSKFGTKLTALKHGKLSHLLQTFGKTDLCDVMMYDAEEFLVGILSSDFTSGNKLRLHRYHQMKRFDLEKLPPPSSSIRLHIKRIFFFFAMLQVVPLSC